MSNKPPKKSSGNKAAIGAAAIGSAAVTAALLYAGKRFLKKAEDSKTPPTIPSGEPPETD
ncbi:MAG: isopropylmalate isomerase [Erythrobacter sp.]|jgi:hypothetical protein|nr:isopropylmalate isomerase [Erythrobacter sp.]